ncbi:MAG TPA: sigma-70 family RNA polymerase sigma factor [Bryobacteraceae bacterium]|jgi:RNA polymerase sigma-70 factor (ECF subfamily)|nr:sigma-70 family RNA polymerase sigma factor [Bryobacteraceae bacterium]
MSTSVSDSFLSLPLSDAKEKCARPTYTELEKDVTTLFDMLRSPLLRYLLSIGLPVDDAEEIVQEVFLALFRHLRGNKSRENLPAWIFRVAHNLGLKRRARNSLDVYRNTQTEQGYVEGHADPAPSIEQQLVGRQKQQRIQAALRALPEQDQFCLYLRMEGLRYRQIAETLGMSLGSVALSLQRSLARLRSVEERCA